MHWILAVVHFGPKESSIGIYDSLRKSNQKIGYEIREYLNAESMAKRNRPLKQWDYKVWDVKGIPKQKPSTRDCGLFLLKYAEFISRNVWIRFDPEKSKFYRYWL